MTRHSNYMGYMDSLTKKAELLVIRTEARKACLVRMNEEIKLVPEGTKMEEFTILRGGWVMLNTNQHRYRLKHLKLEQLEKLNSELNYKLGQEIYHIKCDTDRYNQLAV